MFGASKVGEIEAVLSHGCEHPSRRVVSICAPPTTVLLVPTGIGTRRPGQSIDDALSTVVALHHRRRGQDRYEQRPAILRRKYIYLKYPL